MQCAARGNIAERIVNFILKLAWLLYIAVSDIFKAEIGLFRKLSKWTLFDLEFNPYQYWS